MRRVLLAAACVLATACSRHAADGGARRGLKELNARAAALKGGQTAVGRPVQAEAKEERRVRPTGVGLLGNQHRTVHCHGRDGTGLRSLLRADRAAEGTLAARPAVIREEEGR